MSKNSETVLVRLKPDVKKQLQELADKDRRPLAEFVRNILEDVIKGKQLERQNLIKYFNEAAK